MRRGMSESPDVRNKRPLSPNSGCFAFLGCFSNKKKKTNDSLTQNKEALQRQVSEKAENNSGIRSHTNQFRNLVNQNSNNPSESATENLM